MQHRHALHGSPFCIKGKSCAFRCMVAEPGQTSREALAARAVRPQEACQSPKKEKRERKTEVKRSEDGGEDGCRPATE